MRLNHLFKWMFSFVLVVLVFFITACTEDQMQHVMDEYGYSEAFMQYNGNDITLYNDTAQYYLGNVSGEYYTAASFALARANSSSSNLSISSSSSSTSLFRFYTYYDDDKTLGLNSFSYYTSTAQIYTSYINLNSYYLNSYTLDEKKHVAIHELGHTLGLDDVYEDVIYDYTIMWYQYNSGMDTYADYQDFDLENIHWQYGD